MKYRDEWKGRLTVTINNVILWDGDQVGLLRSCDVKGATSPKGMVTNKTWTGHPSYETLKPEPSPVFQSADQAIAFVLSTLPPSPMRFSIEECGDPYSKHWQAHEHGPHGVFFRGDLPHLSRTGLEAYLRANYPGCKITRE